MTVSSAFVISRRTESFCFSRRRICIGMREWVHRLKVLRASDTSLGRWPYSGPVGHHGAEDHRCGRLLAGKLREGSGERGRDRGGDGPESEMGTRVRARNGVGREESEVVPRHGADLLRRGAMNLTRGGRATAGRFRTGPKSFPHGLHCAARESPSTPGPTPRARSCPHGTRTGLSRLSAPTPPSESRWSAKG